MNFFNLGQPWRKIVNTFEDKRLSIQLSTRISKRAHKELTLNSKEYPSSQSIPEESPTFSQQPFSELMSQQVYENYAT